ncbi:membrane protein [Mycobacterium phage Rialto]|nr:membrane protein [Mycobacterium phage Rialto]
MTKRVAGAIGTGLLGGVALTALLSWGFVTGTLPFVEKIIDDRPDL